MTVAPASFVVVTSRGDGVISGKVVVSPSRIGVYDSVASPDSTIPPTEAGIDVLNVYEGIERDGVGSNTFGSVVGTVADADAKKSAID